MYVRLAFAVAAHLEPEILIIDEVLAVGDARFRERCFDRIEALRAAGEVGVTNLSKYVAYFAAKSTNRNAKKILLKDIEPEEESGAKAA